MRKILLLTAAFVGFSAPCFAADAPAPPVPAPAAATPASQAGPAFTDAQRTEIEDIIKSYLVDKHPEVMVEGLQNVQKREQEKAESKSKEQVGANKDKIFNDPSSPVGGNPKGDVTVVEFYDYQCGYCKMSEESVERLLKEDKNVKFVYKDFPILGPVSGEAAKASMASIKQGKFQAFHDALMTKKEHITSDMIYQTAKDVGLDVEKLKKDMADSAINDAINKNLKLGQEIGVRGTPMFIVNDATFPGALQYEQLKQAVSDARTGKKS